MSALLVSIAAVLIAQPVPGDTVAPAVAAFNKACVEVRGDRGAFENVARAQGWTPVETNLGNREWVVGFRSDGLIIRLSQYRSETLEGGAIPARICAVDRIEAGSEWEQKVAALQVDGRPLGASTLPDPEVYQIPASMEVRVWDLADGSRIHASYIPARSYLELSINYPTGR